VVPVRVEGLPARRGRIAVDASATAELSPLAGQGMPTIATGGGYAGPLAYRMGIPMRPDVALAFDRLAAAARADGVALTISSGFRSDAEQARLFAANPDPKWVAPPGQSLHRNATELDLGPQSAYGWLASNAPRFGFVMRYSWEPWHWGYTRAPGSASLGFGSAIRDGRSAIPAFVPGRYVDAISRASQRWNVGAALLAAQLYAESGFDPDARSPAGAQGIAQFMPGTAAGYGLSNPFDAEAAIDAQAHLMHGIGVNRPPTARRAGGRWRPDATRTEWRRPPGFCRARARRAAPGSSRSPRQDGPRGCPLGTRTRPRCARGG
jgi:hypothetical protein